MVTATRRGLIANLFTQTQIVSSNPSPSLAAHAANRLMYGPAEGDVEHIEDIGYEAFLQEQLDPNSIDDSEAQSKLESFPVDTYSEDNLTLYDRRSASPYQEAIRPLNEVRHNSFGRRLYSKKQLFERMAEFWHDHFNVMGSQYIIRSMFTSWDLVMRRNALGNFRAFLEETAKHPCMLYYLDNYLSTNGGPNENYARELIELHTLGAMNYNIPSGYIDDDVYETSRCFTGWTFERDKNEPTRGEFKYEESDHDRFQKYVLGQAIPRDQPPLKDGLDVLDLLAFHPGTAKHIATKLCVKFISDTPPQSIVDSTAQVFMEHKDSPDQIKETLAHLLSSDEFKQSAMQKFKRPFDWMLSAMRILEITHYPGEGFKNEWVYEQLGQPIFEWTTPDGTPDTEDKWISSYGMMRRWNFVLNVVNERYSNNGLLMTRFRRFPTEIDTPSKLVEYVIPLIIPFPVSTATKDGLLDFVADGRNPDIAMNHEDILFMSKQLMAMCTMTPEFMRK